MEAHEPQAASETYQHLADEAPPIVNTRNDEEAISAHCPRYMAQHCVINESQYITWAILPKKILIVMMIIIT